MENVLLVVLIGMFLALVFSVVEREGYFSSRKKPAAKTADIVTDAIAELVVKQFGEHLTSIADIEALQASKLRLEATLRELCKEGESIKETFERKQRDLEHAAGLLHKEMDAEMKIREQTAKHEADQRILTVERDFNQKQLAFSEKRFEGELKTLNSLVETLTERLPDVNARIKLNGSA